MKKLGLIINPIAGMGGKVGLKGTDGPAILARALEMGATSHAPERAAEALEKLLDIKEEIQILTFPGDMGERVAKQKGFSPTILLKGVISGKNTTCEDTILAAKELLKQKVDLLLFAGGDGTARDICESVGSQLAVLGIPSGVKIHSAVFGCSPQQAGEVAQLYLKGQSTQKKLAEVMDIDEDLFRSGVVTAKLYGYLNIPFERRRVQRLKAGSPASEEAVHQAIADHIIHNEMDADTLYIIGPGTTTRAVMSALNLDYSLLGVDCVCNKRLVGKDLSEEALLKLCAQHKKVKLLITPIGGQGFLLGRGNQQISPRVLHFVSRDDLFVLCTPAKLCSLEGSPLLIDTGDTPINQKFSGYIHLITGYKEYVVYKVR
jgi:predicted polyphosphate/ATP-dependent NAD kinase